MNSLANQLVRGSSRLTELGVGFALVGDLAVSARTEPRFTRDADLAVGVANDLEAELVVRHFLRSGYELVSTVEDEATSRLATARLVDTDVYPSITDLLFASSGIEPEIAAAADSLVLAPGVAMPVARIGHLIVMKLLARDDRRRPTDADDLAALRSRANERDWREANVGATLVMERGFARGRDLAQLLTTLRLEGAF